MTEKAKALDAWIRSDFREINTGLEQLYFCQPDHLPDPGLGETLTQRLVEEGRALIRDLLDEGNTDEGFDSGFDLLGNVGFYMAACRRHEITEPSRETRSPLQEASALALQLGASLGVIPRFASSHLETHNRAISGVYKTFTDLDDEKLFLDYNTRSVFAFIRASEALRQILPLGVSHPVTYDLLLSAKQSLEEVYAYNQELFEKLDVDRFFYCVRPYYRPHRVGLHEYRGANAGDFAGINVIDLLLGLCRADDPYYSQLLVDKFLFMRPEDQLVLRDCMRRTSLLDSFLATADADRDQPWVRKNLELFLQVCHAHGQTALQHHEQLVNKFIERPADAGVLTKSKGITASGPPLPVLLKSLRKLCDMRCAADVGGAFKTRHGDIEHLKGLLL
ncbi:hypothetical protein U062_00390 [Gammaproteobacteria bacterium MOLA455]|nr:hypothetical protein U062_00390 [Gammaproteobacteria bacterium MOLA455]